jgi:putative ABC transport system permease protein
MRWIRVLRVSARTLWAHRLRTILSLLAMTVGVATVVVMAAVGQGSEKKVLDSIRSMGTNLISVAAGRVTVVAGRTRQSAVVTSLVPGDAEAIRAGASGLVALAVPAQSRAMPVAFQDVSLRTTVIGTTPGILAVRNLRMDAGDMFDEEDDRASRRVAVVGQTVVRNVFGGRDPVGQTLRIGKVPFQVMGTLAAAGVDMNGTDQDDQILVPLRTAMRRVFNVTHISHVYVQVRSEDQMAAAAGRLREILREQHHLRAGRADDFTIQNQAELLRAQEETQRTFTTLTLGVASLSLAVGGVGILAVMLMSVRERIREIGLRRALGARRGDILFQFLAEALILSVSGGLSGMLLGVVVALVVAQVAGWDAVLAAAPLLLAGAASITTGLLFGTVPARKASLASPATSLRAE